MFRPGICDRRSTPVASSLRSCVGVMLERPKLSLLSQTVEVPALLLDSLKLSSTLRSLDMPRSICKPPVLVRLCVVAAVAVVAGVVAGAVVVADVVPAGWTTPVVGVVPGATAPPVCCGRALLGINVERAAITAIFLLLVPTTRFALYSNSFRSGTTITSPSRRTIVGAFAPACTAL